jgi:tRNA threonylcarbamoyladenosine biosynthesis protein TsaB
MLLALDTSTKVVGVALYDGERVLSETVWFCQDHHTVELAPAVAETLGRAHLKVKDLQALAVTTGPGSFTGLRIGLALAKGLALARHIPLIGVPTLDVLAASQPVQNLPLVVLIQVGRGRLAAGRYTSNGNAWKAVSVIEVLAVEVLARRIQQPTLVCGEITAEERRILGRKRKTVILASPAQSLRRPSFLGELAWQRWQSGQVDDPATLAPTYLHYNDPIRE